MQPQADGLVEAHHRIREGETECKFLLVPTEVDQILFEGESFWPIVFYNDAEGGLQVFDARHHGVVVLYEIIHRQHAKSKFFGFEYFRRLEVES